MWERRRIELKIKVKRRMAFLGKCLIIRFVMIINWISLGEVCYVGSDIGRQLVRHFSIKDV